MFEQEDPAHSRTLATKCYGCKKAKEECVKLNRCASCLVITYCCRECQKNDWDEHKHFCKIVKKCPDFFRDDYDGYAYRQYLIFEATKHCTNQSEKDSIAMTMIRNLIIQNHHDLMTQKCFSMEGLMALKEALLIDLAHSKRDKSIAFMQTPRAAHAVLELAYTMMSFVTKRPAAMKPLNNLFLKFAREFLRILSQMLCHQEAAIAFLRLLEADMNVSRIDATPSFSLLQLLVKFMTEFDCVADDVEGLAWLCFALGAIHLENERLNSTVIEDVLNLVQLAGREAKIIPKLYNLAKLHASQKLMR